MSVILRQPALKEGRVWPRCSRIRKCFGKRRNNRPCTLPARCFGRRWRCKPFRRACSPACRRRRTCVCPVVRSCKYVRRSAGFRCSRSGGPPRRRCCTKKRPVLRAGYGLSFVLSRVSWKYPQAGSGALYAPPRQVVARKMLALSYLPQRVLASHSAENASKISAGARNPCR